MECFKIENLSFTYPESPSKTLDGINLTINQGEFVTICGKSGCGKTTLLRLLKPSLSPFGKVCGSLFFNEKPLSSYDAHKQASEIGFVMQNIDNQIVCDKVWHELAFGLENLGFSTPEIRTRVAEMASFFGIAHWFHKKVTELSGGQKQLLNLASVMVMQPSVLILDEPTSQLDPIAAQEFLKILEKINRELGVAVILTEHRLEDAFSLSDRIVVMDNGKIIADSTPLKVGEILKCLNHEMYRALPSPMRIYHAVENAQNCPLTVRDGRIWLEKYSKENPIFPELIPCDNTEKEFQETVIEAKDLWFRYEKNSPDIIKGLNIEIKKNEFFAILGGNGTGKTTILSLLSGLNSPYRGKIRIDGKDIGKISELYNGILGVLPQNPQSIFVKKTVFLDLMEVLSSDKLSKEENIEKIKNISTLCHIDHLLTRHPYDLSGGEQQRAALAKVLLKAPRILLLDEPTKGMDAHFKDEFADILKTLAESGVTVVMVSHDIEFCAQYADRCAMVFDGNITSCGMPREFFAGNSFYTTAVNRMARTILPKAILAEDVIRCFGKEIPKKTKTIRKTNFYTGENSENISKPEKKKLTPLRIAAGCVFALLFILTSILKFAEYVTLETESLRIILILLLSGSFLCFFPQKEFGTQPVPQLSSDRKLPKRTLFATVLILLVIPLTIFFGIYCLGDRKYYFISLFIILETMLPFCMIFESRKPKARELVVISVLCGIAVAGRAAFFSLPHFKPVVALVIISGICFGGETGFLVGAITGFVSNFFFGQGPWTPWQMFAFGIIGFLSGILFKKGLLKRTKTTLCIFGFFAAFFIYGGIMNPSSVIQIQKKPTLEMIMAAYVSGAPFDFVHALSTAFFLWFISGTMIEKLERIKIKYGLIER